MALPTHLDLQLVTPDRLARLEQVDECGFPARKGISACFRDTPPCSRRWPSGAVVPEGSEKTYISLGGRFRRSAAGRGHHSGATRRARRRDRRRPRRAAQARRGAAAAARPMSTTSARIALAKSLARLQVRPASAQRAPASSNGCGRKADAAMTPCLRCRSAGPSDGPRLRRTSNEDSHSTRAESGCSSSPTAWAATSRAKSPRA